MCLRNVSISRRHLCALSSIQFPNSSLIQQETNLRRFSSFAEPSAEFSSNKSNEQSPDVISENSSSAIRTYPEKFIFSPNRPNDPDRTIFVGGLSKFTTEQSLYKYFLPYGTITGCKLARNIKTGVSNGFGFVEFELVGKAKSACELEHPHVIDGQEVGVRLGSRKKLQQKFKLFVGGLSKETSVETLREYFSKFGQISECAILRNIANSSRGFGFVTFKSQESVDSVLNSSPHSIDYKVIDVKQTPVRQREFTLIVQKLSPNTTSESLRAFYSRFGRLTESNGKLDPKTGQSRGFGYVAFSSQEDLDSALNSQPHLIDGTEVTLDYATNKFDVIVNSLSLNITEEALSDFFHVTESFEDVIYWSRLQLLQALADRPHIINGKMVNTHQKDQDFILYVGNLPFGATDDSLFETFSKYGKIVHWEVKRDRNTNRSRGFGYVSFEKAEEVVQALKGGPFILNGKALRVNSSKTISLSKKSFK